MRKNKIVAKGSREDMLANRLIELVEDHSGHIVKAAIEGIRQERDLGQMAKFPADEFRGWAKDVLTGLQSSSGRDDGKNLAKRCEALGSRCYQESIPLHETVRAIQILKRAIIDFIRREGFGPTTLEIYSEAELEDRINLFFDGVLYHAARGYGSAAGRGPRDERRTLVGPREGRRLRAETGTWNLRESVHSRQSDERRTS